MKLNLSKGSLLFGALIALPGLPFPASAASIVYDNTTANQSQFYVSPNEYGDQITLMSGTDRTLSQFSFYYYLSAGSGSATLRFYDNTGAGGAPNNVLFTSDPIVLSPSYNTQTITFDTSNPANFVTVPDTFTWTIQFSGLGVNQAGLLVYGPPTTGSSFNDFWENSGTWSTRLISGGAVPGDFAGRVLTTVPEPSVLALGALALLAGVARCRRLSA